MMQTCSDVAVGILFFYSFFFFSGRLLLDSVLDKGCNVREQCLFGVDLSIVDVCTVSLAVMVDYIDTFDAPSWFFFAF